jgi:cyclase
VFRFRVSLLALTAIALSGFFDPIVLVADSVFTEQRTVTRLAEGVYVIRHKDSPDGNLNGNTTVIIGTSDVFVVDSCFQLSAAAEDVAQIRRWTDKPVRYLLNTHWHNDHNMGNGIYQAAFPELAVVAHADTRRDMYRSATTPSRFAQQIATRQQRLASRTDADGKPLTDAAIAAIEKSLAGKTQVLQELGAFRYQAPTIAFEHELDVDIGGRTIQVRHLGRSSICRTTRS